MFTCADWTALTQDFDILAAELVSITLVADPFGSHTPELLARTFDRVSPYKQHFVTDLSRDPSSIIAARQRRNTRRALERVQVAECPLPRDHLDEWITLYAGLVHRHGIRGIQAFSPISLAAQLDVPGLRMFRAIDDAGVVGIHLWYVQGEVAYGHLGATNERGYEAMAGYALYWHALQALRSSVRWLDLGGVPDPGDGPAAAGLHAFKQGWATDTRTAWLCGRILQPERYLELTRAHRAEGAAYFPAYRAPAGAVSAYASA